MDPLNTLELKLLTHTRKSVSYGDSEIDLESLNSKMGVLGKAGLGHTL